MPTIIFKICDPKCFLPDPSIMKLAGRKIDENSYIGCNGFIFAILVGTMTVEAGNVKYTFNREAAVEKYAAESADLAKEQKLAKELEKSQEPETTESREDPYVKITTTASAYDQIDKIKAEPGKNTADR